MHTWHGAGGLWARAGAGARRGVEAEAETAALTTTTTTTTAPPLPTLVSWSQWGRTQLYPARPASAITLVVRSPLSASTYVAYGVNPVANNFHFRIQVNGALELSNLLDRLAREADARTASGSVGGSTVIMGGTRAPVAPWDPSGRSG